MRKPNPKVHVVTWSELQRLKRRFEVAIVDGVGDGFDRDEVPLARFTTVEEADAYAERVKAFLATPVHPAIGKLKVSPEVQQLLEEIRVEVWNAAIEAAAEKCKVRFECGCGDSFCGDCERDRARRYAPSPSNNEVRAEIMKLVRPVPTGGTERA